MKKKQRKKNDLRIIFFHNYFSFTLFFRKKYFRKTTFPFIRKIKKYLRYARIWRKNSKETETLSENKKTRSKIQHFFKLIQNLNFVFVKISLKIKTFIG